MTDPNKLLNCPTCDRLFFPIQSELLAACHSALKLLRGSGFTDNQPTIIELKNAIAKAENKCG